MALKQRHRTAEIAANDTKMGWNCHRDREKHKYNLVRCQQRHRFLPNTQKRQVLKFRQGTYIEPA